MKSREAPVDELIGRIGEEVGTSAWFTVDQDRINAFADATNDHHYIHTDPVAAATTEWGTTIAHGFLTLSLAPFLISGIRLVPEGTAIAINYGSDRVRYLEPVRVGSDVRARVRLVDVTDKGRERYLVKNGVTIEIRGEDRPAMVADLLTLFVVR